MPVSIIENFQLGTNLPLDARYVVGHPNDVSLYWYDGMLIYNSSTNQLFVVKDTLAERIVEILDSSSAQIESIDGSISYLYVDQAAQDVSIKWLVDNTYTKIYIDGSLNLKVNQTLFDSSISSLTIKDQNQDVSINGIWAKLGYVDTSLNNLGIKNSSQDASIVALRNEDIRQDGSLNALFLENDIQDASIVLLRDEDIRQDGSLNKLFAENDTQDASIIALRNEDIRQDGSLNLLFQENDIQDASIIRIDGSINNLYDTKVNRAGDTMTGDLIISGAGLDVSTDVSIGQDLFINNKIRLATYDNLDPSFGDLWRDPSGPGHLYFYHQIEGEDASSYDLVNRLLRTPNDWGVSFPESSALVVGDRVLIEKAGSGYAKEWVSAEAFANSTVALLYPAYTDSLPEQSTTSITPVLAASLTGDPSSVSGAYRIGWSLQVANSKNTKTTYYSVELDGSIVESVAVTAIAANSYNNWSGFQTNYLSQDSSGHTLEVYYYADTGSTAYIRNVRLEYRKADVEIQ